MNRKYWTPADQEKLELARTYADLYLVAEGILKRMHQPVGQICGPISTGGSGSRAENLARLESVIIGLQEHGLELFDQIPFQVQMEKIGTQNTKADELELLESFYLPMFENKLVQTLYFLPGWESSYGARWEYEQGKRLGMHMVYLQ